MTPSSIPDDMLIGRPHDLFGRGWEWSMVAFSIATGTWIFFLAEVVHFSLPSTLTLPGWLWPLALIVVGSMRAVAVWANHYGWRRFFACLAMCAWAFAGEALIERQFYAIVPPLFSCMVLSNFAIYWLLRV